MADNATAAATSAAAAATTSLSPPEAWAAAGLNPPPFMNSDEDHAGTVMVIAALMMTWMVLCAIIRCYLRVAVNGPFASDDYTLIAGTVSLLTPDALLSTHHRTAGRC